MRKMLAVVAALGLLSSASGVEAKGRTQTFAAPRERVWAVARDLVAQNYTVNSANEVEGIISFRAGTQEASLLIVAASETETLVTVNSKAAHMGFAWGMGIDSRKLQGKVMKGIAKGLGLEPPKD